MIMMMRSSAAQAQAVLEEDMTSMNKKQQEHETQE